LPRTNIALTGTPGLAGWYRSPVTVSLSGVDNTPGSGLAVIEYSVNGGGFQAYATPFVVSGQGATQITARSRDRAGNVENPLPSATMMIDAFPPVVTLTSPVARDYVHSESVAVSFAAADGLSGVQSVSASVDGNAVQDSQSISLVALALGAHTLEVVASDAAGNQTRQSVSFRIVATIDSLIASVGIYVQQGKIDASNQRGLLAKLNDAKAAFERGNMSSASAKLHDVIDQCQAQSGRGISPDAATLLALDAEYVRGTF
jgi:cytochrome c